MTTADESPAITDADSSTFGHPEESGDTNPVPVLCENDRNTPSLDATLSVNLRGGEPLKMEGRGLYRLVFGILMIILALLLDSRRVGEAASLMLL